LVEEINSLNQQRVVIAAKQVLRGKLGEKNFMIRFLTHHFYPSSLRAQRGNPVKSNTTLGCRAALAMTVEIKN